MAEIATARPKYSPRPCTIEEDADCLRLSADVSGGEKHWSPILSCAADFPQELFEVALLQLIDHPEYNSTLILRSERLDSTTDPSQFPSGIPDLCEHKRVRTIRRRLLPRRPGRDPSIEQHCTFYTARNSGERGGHDLEETEISCVVLTPIVKAGEVMPFYHPAVSHLAFRYIHNDASTIAQLRIEVIPISTSSRTTLTPPPVDPSSRLYRTCLALLETVHRYGYGALTNYQKRVHHDCVVPREDYQDLYLVMRERHRHLVSEWKETTDPAKHVFEDIGIATFLMLLWKQNIFAGVSKIAKGYSAHVDSERMPWLDWPRPPGGFLDLGCGNGLLTHILTAEGYVGIGIDLRARNSWSHYPASTQERLQVHALDPLSLHPQTRPPFLASGAFIIANHADELTPWTPVLATLCNASGFLSIPCCAWSFDARFERGMATNGIIPSIIECGDNVHAKLDLGGGGATSSYALYRVWLANLSLHCGWENEYETLRIPSTRNWSIIGRRRRVTTSLDGDTTIKNIEEILQWVRDRGVFKTRKPEGKAGGH